MTKIFKSIADVFCDTAKRKAAVATRTNSQSDANLAPRDVYLNVCQSIAEAIADDGFSYAKSGPHCTKNFGGFRFRIAFQSSHNNIAGEHIALWMHANVMSPTLKSWRIRQPNPYRTDDWVAGGMVHNLSGNHAMVEWELALPDERKKVVEEVVGFVRSNVLIYFSLFSDTEKLIDTLAEKEIRAFDLASSVEFSICFGGREQGQKVLDRFVRQHPELDRDIHSAGENLQKEGFPSMKTFRYAEQVAWMRQAYCLK